ncbi:MAG: hypothetical protein ACYC3L_05195 [Gemmatimonadaceae bacterium]
MTSTTRSLALLGVATLAASSALGAQTVDARWEPWIGCWAPVAGEPSPLRLLGASPRVCVVPAQGTSAVDVLTIAAGKVVDRARIEADYQPHQVSRDGCTGTETAHWSELGTRVYLSSALTCAGGVSRRGTGVLSLSERYEFLDVRGMTSGKTSGVSVGRLAAADVDSATIPADVRSLVPPRTSASNSAALAAAAALTLADIADVATSADSSVTSAWLMERTRGLKLSINGKQLAALADAGVAPSVIDFVVALAHPAVFGFDAKAQGAGDASGRLTGQNRGFDAYSYPYGPLGYYGYSRYDPCYSYGAVSMLYGYGIDYGCNGYGYSRYGMYSPYGGSYYNGYYPPIIIVRSPDSGGGASMPSHGRVVKGQGYTSGGGGSTGTTASPSRGLTSGGGGQTTSSGSSGSSGSASSSGSSGSSGGGRTAVKKP